jgi:hypothetical protein
MQAATPTAPASSKQLWTGRIMSAVPILFLLFDSVIKLMKIDAVVKGFRELGYSPDIAVGIGTLLLVCVILYAIPQTSILGAILLTGYLGGAVATQVRVGNPLFSHVLFPTYVGALIWGGLYLREGRLRALLPLRS